LTGLFHPLPDETRRTLDRLPELIDSVFPLPGRYRRSLPNDVAELSRLLTYGREDRGGSYLGKPALLSAYLRYFLPWNVYRLCRLFGCFPLSLKPDDAINDLGAGPLTLALSLWISRPELRNMPLEFRCVDRTAAALEAGKKLFTALRAQTAGNIGENFQSGKWNLKTIRGELRNSKLSVEIRGKPAAMSAALNVYNELFWNFSPHDTNRFAYFAEKQAGLLSSLTERSGSILVVEPGIPRSGEFISLLRSSLIKEGRGPLSPCTHPGTCPFPGGGKAEKKSKWCHFAFDTEDAPPELRKLSAAARIPKERAVLSFLLAGPAAQETKKREPSSGGLVKIRIISDAFPVEKPFKKNTWGRYGCAGCGPVLVTGSKTALETSPPGAIEELCTNGLIDAKSGALTAAKK
jgi:hypothetical protein